MLASYCHASQNNSDCSTQFSLTDFTMLKTKKKNIERDHYECEDYLKNYNCQDLSALLTIINPDESERPYFNLRNVLASLHNNQFTLNQEQNRRNYAIKPFIAQTKEKLLKNERIKKLRTIAIADEKHIEEFNECIPTIHQLFEVIKLQYDQICTAALMFETQQSKILKSLYFILKYQQEINKRPSQRVLVINLLGYEEDDFAKVNEIRLSKGQILYISLSNKSFSRGQNYYNCYINSNQKITWEQFKHAYRIEMRNLIQKFNPQLCILQVGIDFQNVQIFEEDCLEHIMRKFSKVSKNKVIAYLTIKNSNEQAAANNDQLLLDQKIEYVKLKAMINSLQQGVLRSKTPKKNSSNYQWLQQTINDLKQQSASQQVIGLYQQLLSNVMVAFPKLNEPPQQHYFQLINPQLSEIMIIQFIFNGKHLINHSNTEVHFRYEENIVAILQPSESALFYAKLDYQRKEQNCYKFQINEEKINDINPTIAIDKGIIYLLYGFLGDKLLACDTTANKITKMNKKNKSSIIQQWKREGARAVYNLKNYPFVLVGGELLDDAPQLCNVFEFINLEPENTFSSGFLRKDELFMQQSYKPWQNQVILENAHFKIFLPGNYDNHKNKYFQVINSDHYKQAQKLTVDKKGKYSWSNLEIHYTQSDPDITIFSSNQRNVRQINENCWQIAVSGLEEENGVKLKQKGAIDDYPNFENCLSNILHTATITLEKNQLNVHINSYRIGDKQVIAKKSLVL